MPPAPAACHHHGVNSRPFRLRNLTIGDDPAGWAAAGFTIDDDTIRIADTTISLVGPDAGRGILAATVDGIADPVDGMPFTAAAAGTDRPAPGHANLVSEIDHLVAMSPDMDRTTDALSRAGLELRRTRTFAVGGGVRRQCFFWLGDVILELVGDDAAHGDGPAQLWGLAFTSADLAGSARLLGDRLGSAKPAVQKDREIATLRTAALDISVPVVFMSAHDPDGPTDSADA